MKDGNREEKRGQISDFYDRRDAGCHKVSL